MVCRIVVANVQFPFGYAVAIASADLAIVFLIVVALLQQSRKGDRVLQTVTALAGAGTLLNIIALPLMIAIVGTKARGSDSGNIEILLLGLMCWNLAIVAHVLRHALSIRFATGAVLAFILMVVTYLVVSALFPDLSSRTFDGHESSMLPGRD